MDNIIKKYLDGLYGDLRVSCNKDIIIWYKNESPVACIVKDYPRVYLSNDEFNSILSLFSLPWVTPEEDLYLLSLISPYLKLEGGSLSTTILTQLGFVPELKGISIPSNIESRIEDYI